MQIIDYGVYCFFPIIECTRCRYRIRLPYAEMPQVPGDQWPDSSAKDLIEWPEGTWSSLFACPQCGLCRSYDVRALEYETVVKPTGAEYHSGGSLFVVSVECARADCRTPATLNVQKDTRLEYADSEAGVLRGLADGFFRGQLPCGHDLIQIPRERYRVHLTLSRLW